MGIKIWRANQFYSIVRAYDAGVFFAIIIAKIIRFLILNNSAILIRMQYHNK